MLRRGTRWNNSDLRRAIRPLVSCCAAARQHLSSPARQCSTFVISASRGVLLGFLCAKQGRNPVDLALKLNVLAFGAVVVFLGAIVLGAF